MDTERDHIELVSEAIANLTYGEMVQFAKTLAGMAQDREEFKGTEIKAWALAELLWDWSESVEIEMGIPQ